MVLARKHPKIGIHYVKLILYKKLRSNHRFSKIRTPPGGTTLGVVEILGTPMITRIIFSFQIYHFHTLCMAMSERGLLESAGAFDDNSSPAGEGESTD